MGKQIEVLWKYHDKDTGEPMLIWSTGRVARVADGLTDKRSSRAQKLLPAGMLLWQWDADPEFGEKAGQQWLHLLPAKWNSTAGASTPVSLEPQRGRRRRRRRRATTGAATRRVPTSSRTKKSTSVSYCSACL